MYETVASLGLKIVDVIVGPIQRRWGRRKLANQLHTDLYRIIHDRPESHGHSPRFYERTADNLDQAVEVDLFSTDERDYLAQRLAVYCRAKADGKPADTVDIDKSFLGWTRIAETEGMHTFDVSEIEKRLRYDLEQTYRTGRFEHPVGEGPDLRSYAEQDDDSERSEFR